ncbi:hypothetical protein ASPSYDRAFT_898223 [Aspergillus sydowii CBS 593.65]|uniref:Secreted protein n=1 Tax=Aspergillus sydowii CBS 593.65 TaxID=1036612 RepID=A0A1L9TK76_9EURO|nr:uncharacterized protein ASPSYDRAFT_898223 [Aspergillus sydowii CBS 593.65]OJJ59781.1 hypothetical protein ASPSYDRAFT_898223 [Aspergillus sydowii CBS 593.65]
MRPSYLMWPLASSAIFVMHSAMPVDLRGNEQSIQSTLPFQSQPRNNKSPKEINRTTQKCPSRRYTQAIQVPHKSSWQIQGEPTGVKLPSCTTIDSTRRVVDRHTTPWRSYSS